MTSAHLKTTVFAALDCAVEGGYTELLTWPAADLALDLVAFSPDHEDCNETDLLPYCQEWRIARGTYQNGL